MNIPIPNNMSDQTSTVTLQNLVISNGCLILMAIFTITIGSLKSIVYMKKLKKNGNKMDIKPITIKDAMIVPVEVAGVLLFFYISVQLLKTNSKDQGRTEEHFNLMCFLITIISFQYLFKLLNPLINALVSPVMPNLALQLSLIKEDNVGEKTLLKLKFSLNDATTTICCLLLWIWYLLTKHWFPSNLFGISLAIAMIEIFHLNCILTACVLMGNLVLYDVCCVYITDIMVTVASSFNAPLKLLVPVGSLSLFDDPKLFSTLGVGDVVYPGMMAALLLRFDISLQRGFPFYFLLSLTGFTMGMILTVAIGYCFKDGQPALLYTIPACLSLPMGFAFVKGDLNALFKYEDYPIQ